MSSSRAAVVAVLVAVVDDVGRGQECRGRIDLPDVHLPTKPPYAVINEHAGESGRDALLVRSIQLLNQGERIALIARQSASATLERLFESTSMTRRLQLSFTTGLKPSPDRRFRIHVLPFINPKIHSQLSALGIRFVATSV